MARGRRVGYRNKSRVRSNGKDSDESDEDYIVDEDQELDESEEDYSSLEGEESEESLGEFEDENEKVEKRKVKKVGRPRVRKGIQGRKKNGFVKPRKKKIVSYREADDDDYESKDDDDDDDDDEEFTLEEIDGADEEYDLQSKKESNPVKKYQVEEKGISRGRKRKRSSKVLKKTTRTKPRRNHHLKRKTRSCSDGEFTENASSFEQKNKKIVGHPRRKRQLTLDSDSDFVSSGPSDYEYTISEEEREQIREANEFCRGLNRSMRSSNSSRKLQELAIHPQKKRSGRKDKEKVEDLKIEAGKQVCGICLSEEGKRTVRGTLNCCNHYFCFACIMEWSKVESRCPLCKQRFATISKPARSNTGFDLRTVLIQVPERDQVYQPSEEELRGYLDPYENVICTECHQGGDDALMLLCDICDSPAHTYCVGLGHEVPEGNWYCEGCRPTAMGSSNPTPDNRTGNNLSVGSSPVASVRESFDLNEMYVPDTPSMQETANFASPRRSFGDVQAASPGFGSGAFTVSDRRRIQRQIHQLLNSRRQLDSNTNGILGPVSGNSLFGSQVGRSRDLAPQLVLTPERNAVHNMPFHGRFQDNTLPLSHERAFLSGRPTYLSGQVNQNPASVLAESSFGGLARNEFGGINSRISLGLSHQQLHPCSSPSNLGPDGSMSAYQFREVSSLNVEKEQVQSMVRSHLKSLCRDVDLGYNTFKDIARGSTHTILAACGLEHRQADVYPVDTCFVCKHVERTGDRQICSVRGPCSSCFDLFVRNIVKEIMSKRVALSSKD